MKRIAALCVPLLVALLSGCPPGQGDALRGGPGRMPGTDAASTGNQLHVRFVFLRIVTFEVPAGAASASEQIWSYLDEESIGVQQGVSLARNGIRMGIGREKDWPDLARILKQMTGRRVRQTTVTALPGVPVPLELKRKQPGQTIFTFYEDLTLSGADYPAGDNLLTIACTLDEDDPTIVRLTGLPQIRSTYRKPTVLNRPGEPMIVERPVIYDLPSLMFQVTVASRDFLVIGPNSQSQRRCSAGRSFLVAQKDGVPFETVQLLVPEVFETSTKAAPDEVKP